MTVFLDYETSGLNYWEPGFEVKSVALTRIDEDGLKSVFYQTRPEIETLLQKLADKQTPVWAYNISFEIGVTLCNFPGIEINWAGDVMRLAQLMDSGDETFVDFLKASGEHDGEEEDAVEAAIKRKSMSGFGLKMAGPRILGKDYDPVEERAYSKLREMGYRKGNERKHLGELPYEFLREYNIGDTENTAKLYKKITDYFTSIKYDWRVDHQLFMSTVKLVTKAKIRGVRVDRERLEKYVASLEIELLDVDVAFRTAFAEPISEIEEEAWEKAKSARKTQRGKEGVPRPTFNISSNQQLARLFCDKLSMRSKFKSAKGQPSFKRSHLPSWGTGGEILAKRRQRMLVLQQAQALLSLSEQDGRWHLSLKCVGTSTGRLAGGN